ncbi:MAG: hypothetical protein KBD90_02900 [Alphaproteobacteria bacterium]|nr:hypothetical protein [Alphaproteobacteria bacterium]
MALKEFVIFPLFDACHARALSQIYPQKPILCGLLWAHLPRLDLIPEAMVNKFTNLRRFDWQTELRL